MAEGRKDGRTWQATTCHPPAPYATQCPHTSFPVVTQHEPQAHNVLRLKGMCGEQRSAKWRWKEQNMLPHNLFRRPIRCVKRQPVQRQKEIWAANISRRKENITRFTRGGTSLSFSRRRKINTSCAATGPPNTRCDSFPPHKENMTKRRGDTYGPVWPTLPRQRLTSRSLRSACRQRRGGESCRCRRIRPVR